MKMEVRKTSSQSQRIRKPPPTPTRLGIGVGTIQPDPSNMTVVSVSPPVNKLKGKGKRDGTPDKPNTPGADGEDGGSEGRPTILNDEEIQGLAIKPDALDKVRQEALSLAPAPPSQKEVKPVTVRKVNKNPPPRRVIKNVTVAKGAPPRAPLKPVETEGNSGPRFDGNGNVIAHSLLGTLEEFKSAAEQRGELSVDYYIREEDRVNTPTLLKQPSVLVKSENNKHPVFESVDESRALVNWQKKMRERKRQQGYISRLLQKPVEQLVMNEGDTYREKQELRYLIDRSIPAVDYGKGYRVGSEFWKQRPLIGDEDTGINMTLSQTEKGYPPVIEHVRVPLTAQRERGIDMNRPMTALNKPWHKSHFLRERVEELGPVMNDLDPHLPDADVLEIIGTNNPYQRYIAAATPISERGESPYPHEVQEETTEANQDPLAKHPDVYTPPIFGPCIKFAGQMLQWSGDSHSSNDKVAVDARVTFEGYAGCRSTSVLEIINLGTTAMYFSWKMLPKSNPFDLVNSSIQRFYFNTSNGVILPGETLRFPFVFKSEKAGVYNEQWQFQTHPVVSGGAALVVTLRGVALREDRMRKQRDLIETKLQRNIVWRNMRRIVDEIVDSIKPPERPGSPIDSYLTEREIFQRQNPHLYYKPDVLDRLGELHKMLVNPPSMDGEEDEDAKSECYEVPVWNLNITQFKREVLSLEEDDERRPAFLENINEAVMNLSFPVFDPRLRKMYQTCFHYLSEMVDNMSGQSIYLRNLLGLPERESHEDESREVLLAESPTSSGRVVSARSSVSAGKRSSGDRMSAGTKTAGSKATPKPGTKEEKKSGKADPKAKGKEKEAPKKNDRASPTKKTPPAKGAAGTTVAPVSSTEGRLTPGIVDGAISPSNTGTNVLLEKKYREKLSAQVFMDMNQFVLDLVDALEAIHAQEETISTTS